MDVIFAEIRRNGLCYAIGVAALVIGHTLSLDNPVYDDLKNVVVAVLLVATGINIILTLREDARLSDLEQRRRESQEIALRFGISGPRRNGGEKVTLRTRGGGEVDFARASRHLSLGLALVIVGLAIALRTRLQGSPDMQNYLLGFGMLGIGSCINSWAMRWWRSIGQQQRLAAE